MHPGFSEALWLVKNGVPYDVAFQMDHAERMAHCVVFGELEGNEYDWTALRWRVKNP
jgi:hypothetical protein